MKTDVYVTLADLITPETPQKVREELLARHSTYTDACETMSVVSNMTQLLFFLWIFLKISYLVSRGNASGICLCYEHVIVLTWAFGQAFFRGACVKQYILAPLAKLYPQEVADNATEKVDRFTKDLSVLAGLAIAIVYFFSETSHYMFAYAMSFIAVMIFSGAHLKYQDHSASAIARAKNSALKEQHA